jgi:hypothetical protein
MHIHISSPVEIVPDTEENRAFLAKREALAQSLKEMAERNKVMREEVSLFLLAKWIVY